CAKTFSTSGNLSRHIRTQHRGESRTAKKYSTSTIVSLMGNSRDTWPATTTVSSLHSAMLPAPENPKYYSPTPFDAYSHSLHHHLPSANSSAGPGRQDAISDSDMALLLDCLFINVGDIRAPATTSASHSLRGGGFQQLLTPSHEAFHVYF
ncbi:hypothetical protein Gpo141_00014766, partial [Globisporangium polare]